MYSDNNLVYIVTMLECIEKIFIYAEGHADQHALVWADDQRDFNAIWGLLLVIGEESKKIDADLKKDFSAITWSNVAGMRNYLAHDYRGIDHERVWAVIHEYLPELKLTLIDMVGEISYEPAMLIRALDSPYSDTFSTSAINSANAELQIMNTATPTISRLLASTQEDKTVWERLPVVVQEAVGEFKQRLQKRYGNRLDGLVLYGSYARGDYNEESDVDLLIVLTDEPEPRLQTINELAHLKYDLLIQYGVLLSTKVVSMQTLVSGKSAVYHFIRKEGVPV